MPSFSKFLPATGLLFLACAAGFHNYEGLLSKAFPQAKEWNKEILSAQTVAYLVDFSANSQDQKNKGNMEVYYIQPDTLILYSPGLLGKGSLRGRWILGKDLLIFFPREKSYFEGKWDNFLLGRKMESKQLDSLIFEILSRRGILTYYNNPEPPSPGIPFKPGKSPLTKDSLSLKKQSVTITKTKSKWSRKESRVTWDWEVEHIFNRRGNLSTIMWSSKNFEIKVDVDKASRVMLKPKSVEWTYLNDSSNVKLGIEQMKVNVEIPVSKKNFKIPADAVRLERIKENEER